MAGAPYLARLLALETLESLKAEMLRIAVSRPGLPIMSAKGIQRVILLEQIPTPAANIIKQEILARGGDLATPWAAASFEAPTVDVLLIGNLTTLRSTISKLYRQPHFDLPQIADAIQKVVVHTTPGYLPVAPTPNRQGIVVEETLEDLMGGRIPLQKGSNRATGRPTLAGPPGHAWRFGEMTYLMGMVDPTADDAWQRATQAVAEGAQLVELSGGLSELNQILPLIRRMREAHPDVLIAVETAHPRVAAQALAEGAHLLADRSVVPENRPVWPVAAGSDVPFVISLPPAAAETKDLVSAVARFFWQAMNEAVASGMREDQIILDPGQDLRLTRRLRELTSFGRPLLHAPAEGQSIGETAATVALGIAGGADIVRVRNVGEAAQCAKMSDLLVRALPDRAN